YRRKTRYPQKDVKLHIEKLHPQPPVDAEAGSSRLASKPGAAPSSASSASPTTNRNPPAKRNTSVNPRQPGARATTTAIKRAGPASRTQPSKPSPTSTPPTTSSLTTPSPLLPARRQSPPVVQQTVWSPAPYSEGFSLVMGKGAWGQTKKRKTPPHEHPGVEQHQRQQQQQQHRRSTPPARDCGEPEVQTGGG
ncbi:predicted GPI-anchored protein 58, partial [Pseudomyrmex gracilis]